MERNLVLGLFCEENLPYTDTLMDILETMDATDEIEWIMIPNWNKNPKWVVDCIKSNTFAFDIVNKTDFFASDEAIYYGSEAMARKLFAGKDFKVHLLEAI